MSSASTAQIQVERQPSRDRVAALGIFEWPIWTKEASTFPWVYDDAETCYFLTGDVVVTPEGGEPVVMGAEDLVTFPAGMACTQEIRAAVKKHDSFG